VHAIKVENLHFSVVTLLVAHSDTEIIIEKENIHRKRRVIPARKEPHQQVHGLHASV
jgi:hypothetical protein